MHLPATEENLDNALWFEYHGLQIDRLKNAIKITVPQVCRYLIFDSKTNTYGCKIYSNRPEVCRKYTCEYMRDS